MAKYQALTKTFIQPHLIAEGQVFTINDEFEPGPHLLPLDDAAGAAMDRYEEKRKELNLPPGTIEPVEALPNQIISLDEAPAQEADLSISMAEAQAGKAQPGPSDGGKVLGVDGKTPAPPAANPKIGAEGKVDESKTDPSEAGPKGESPLDKK